MAVNKTQPTKASVNDFIKALEHEQKRKDSLVLLDMMQQISAAKSVMWGDSIIGFVDYSYKYTSGREGDWFKVGFSPRKQSLTLYLMCGFKPVQSLLDQLGKYKLGKGCLYINKLADVDLVVLKHILEVAVSFNSSNQTSG
ncbi:MAG: DUF1801 domain-containing protein [Marinilabiliaceae bacterium]|nr:DUF1801 domain-containing protein [Marinilabiliaceae bacterium]